MIMNMFKGMKMDESTEDLWLDHHPGLLVAGV